MYRKLFPSSHPLMDVWGMMSVLVIALNSRGWKLTCLRQEMGEWKIPWSLRKLLDQSTIEDWLHAPVLTVWCYQNYFFFFFWANSGWCYVTCHLTVFYVVAYLYLKSMFCCVGWLTEIVQYLFGGSPLPQTPERLQEWYAKIWGNISENLFTFKCELISSQNSWLTIGVEISGK